MEFRLVAGQKDTGLSVFTFLFPCRILKLVDATEATFVGRLVKINSMFCFQIELSVREHGLERKEKNLLIKSTVAEEDEN